jgi:hypothetical protein
MGTWPNNEAFVKDFLQRLLTGSFPNVARATVEAFVEGCFR